MTSNEDLSIASLYNIKGKVALVTGGGSGIGTMIASAYVQNGAKVYIASRKEKQLKEVADALNKRGPGSCHYIVADLGSKAGCDALAEAFKQRESKLHILVNNSGATWGSAYNDTPENQGWDRVMSLNVKSIFYCNLTDVLAKDSNNLDPARVINVSSIASRLTSSTLTTEGHGVWSYHASKAAVNHLSSQLASALAPKFITVNAILPGVFPSKMTAYSYKERGEEGMAAGQPMGRTGSQRDMAGLALFLASPASAHISGAHILIDGGLVTTTMKAAL